MNIKYIAFGLLGLGGILVILGMSIWSLNKPNFMAVVPKGQIMVDRQADARFKQEVLQDAMANERAYNSCLYSSRIYSCQRVVAVPFFTIGGVLVLLVGGGLFMFARNQPRST